MCLPTVRELSRQGQGAHELLAHVAARIAEQLPRVYLRYVSIPVVVGAPGVPISCRFAVAVLFFLGGGG